MTKTSLSSCPMRPDASRCFFRRLQSYLSEKRRPCQNDTTFEEAVSQLEQRIGIVQQGLIRTGVRTVQLGTEEAIELLYKMFNPGEEGKPMPLNS
jgi:hypothetical protein